MHTASRATAIDLVDDGRLSFYQLRVISLCAVIALLDGFDTQAIGFVAPVIARAWNIPIEDFGIVFAVGLFGGLIGALLFGAVADRKGRRTTLLLTVALFGIGSLLTVFATSLFQLGLYRFVTSLGLGGALPAIISLGSEYSPRQHRAKLIVAMFCGFPLGAVIGAILSAPAIETYGWTSVFIAGGILPLLVLPLLAWQIPESVDWLITRGRRGEAEAIVARMRKVPLPAGAATALAPPERSSLARLFGEGRAIGAVLLAIVFFVSLLQVFLLVSWVPTLVVAGGHSIRSGVLAAGLLNMTGILGGLAIAAVSDRAGAFGTVGASYGLGAAGIALVGILAHPDQAIFIFCVLAGLFCIGAQMCAISIASQFYPIELRGTGIGLSMGMGRLGAIAGPLIGATLIGSANPQAALFWLVALLSAGAGACVLAMGLVYRGRTVRAETSG